ncbi:hypothetical protein [Gloeothece verrucosa]|uniref:Uncharacterized protein n=1 Tax=Gloeothece verrucosa (strain PCC 7822) TaxID=497965 RepID=E0UHQ4_GLOV7|nr:hypothetical protein [Gloeothece verrucosa]ADN13311.1 hypothetical protein Cyan7822_1310 [Gloeothece verrucosa PCC 7822]
MTAIVIANNIPSNIATLESLIAHNLLALKETIGGLTFNLDNGVYAAQPYCTFTTGVAYSGQSMMHFDVYLPYDPQLWGNTLNKKSWLYVKEISSNAYPSSYNS